MGSEASALGLTSCVGCLSGDSGCGQGSQGDVVQESVILVRWGEGRLVPRGRGGEDADVVGWEVGDVETRLCREGTRTLPSARTAP